MDLIPEIKLEAAAEDVLSAEAIRLIRESAARTGRIGDGKTFVTQLQDFLRIRTGERGESSL